MDARRFQAWTKTVEWTLIAIACGAMAAPFVDELVREPKSRGPTDELRTPAERPAPPTDWASAQTWPRRYETWFNDFFGLRDAWLAAHSWLKLEVLRAPPAPMHVIGRDGWIFFNGLGSVDDFRGLAELDAAELERWTRRLEARRDWLATQGARYLVVVAPNKESIYPEKFPERFNRVGPTRLDRLLDHLARTSDVEVLDLRPALLAAKSEDGGRDPLYFREGTHWTGRGAWVATREIALRLQRWFPAMPTPSLEDRAPVADDLMADSLRRSMYLRVQRLESNRVWVPRGEKRADFGPMRYRALPGRIVRVARPQPELPRVLVFHDSFMLYTESTLAPMCESLALYWQYELSPAAVETEKPEVVIDMMVERMLALPAMFDFEPPPDDAREWRGATEVVADYRIERDHGRLAFAGDVEPLAMIGEEHFMRLAIDAPDDAVLFPAPPDGYGRDVIARLDVQVPAPCEIELRYRCRGDGPGAQARVQRARARTGRNYLHFDFERNDLEGGLELRFGESRGTCLLRGLELRRARRDRP